MKTWYQGQNLQTGRSHPGVTTCEGYIYAFGGGGEDFKSLNTVEIYDPLKDRWVYGTPLPEARSGAVAFNIKNTLYIAGGGYRKQDGRFHFFKYLDIYDPLSDTWFRGPDMLMPHDYPGGVAFDDKIYIFGGHSPEATIEGPLKDPGFAFSEVFDPLTKKWYKIAPMPTPRFACAAIVFNNEILVMGGAGLREDGFKNFDIVEAYDPRKDCWRREEFTLPWNAAGLCAFVHEGTIFVVGGNSGTCVQKRFACLDKRTGQWIELTSLPAERMAAGWALINNRVYIIGGWDKNKQACSSVFTYELL